MDCIVVFYASAFQQQAVGDHAHAAERHGRAGYHGIEQETAHRIKKSGRYRDADYIIYKGPEQVLPDCAHGQT